MISPTIESQTKSRGHQNLDLIRAFRDERNHHRKQEIRNRILELNLGLVRRISTKYANSPHDENDFFSEGCLGLFDAVEKFDPDRGFQFSTYATTCIRNRIFRLFRGRNRQPREIPLNELTQEIPNCARPENSHPLDRDRRVANTLLQQMPARERELVRLRFGLDETRQSRSFREVGEMAGLSKERVRQLVNETLESVRDTCLPSNTFAQHRHIHE